MFTNKALILSGPTASGKSALAMDIAEQNNGLIINGDALQVYDTVRILTARPSTDDEQRVPHALYGHRSILSHYAVTDWLREIKPVIQSAWQNDQLPIIVGGTGFYLHTLLHGMSPVPDVPESVRTGTMDLYDSVGHDAFRDLLRAVDPVIEARIKPHDRQRLVRAFEVHAATGLPLSTWQNKPRQPILPDLKSLALLLEPPREILYNRINRRFEKMMDHGALDEARAVEDLKANPALPGCKALGLSQLRAYLRGELQLDDAITLAQTVSRQYAKRQMTWLRTQWAETEQHQIIRLIDASVIPSGIEQWLNAAH